MRRRQLVWQMLRATCDDPRHGESDGDSAPAPAAASARVDAHIRRHGDTESDDGDSAPPPAAAAAAATEDIRITMLWAEWCTVNGTIGLKEVNDMLKWRPGSM
jgi:hypothetical protein